MAEVAPPAVPAQTAGAAAEQPAAQPQVQRMLSSQRPPPSPFEDVPAADAAARPPLPPGMVAVPPAEADAAADAADNRRSPRGTMRPSKSALKISSDGGAPAPAQQPAANRALSWADTHGKVRYRARLWCSLDATLVLLVACAPCQCRAARLEQCCVLLHGLGSPWLMLLAGLETRVVFPSICKVPISHLRCSRITHPSCPALARSLARPPAGDPPCPGVPALRPRQRELCAPHLWMQLLHPVARCMYVEPSCTQRPARAPTAAVGLAASAAALQPAAGRWGAAAGPQHPASHTMVPLTVCPSVPCHACIAPSFPWLVAMPPLLASAAPPQTFVPTCLLLRQAVM